MIIPRFLVFLALAVCMQFSCYATDPIGSSIAEVTVYADRARVTRSAAVDVSPGTSVLEFGGFPDGLDVNSLEVSGGSSSGVTIEGVDLRQSILTASVNPRVQEVEHELQQLQDQKSGLAAQKTLLNEKRLFFSSLSTGVGRGDKGTITVDEIREMYGYFGDEATKLSESIVGVEQNERKLDPEIDRVRRELEGLQSAANKSQKRILLSVKAAAQGEAQFLVRYVVPQAGWTPVYDARFDGTGGKVGLEYNAQVYQRTGEDWDNVKVVLSTARPSSAGRMPDLAPVTVDYRTEVPLPAAAPDSFGSEKSAVAAKPRPIVEKMDVEQSRIEESGLSVSYRIGPKVTIPSDGQPHRTNVTILPLEGKPEYVATPKLEPAAFLKLHVTNGSDTPLLPGPMNLFREGEFVGNTSMSLIQSGAEFDLYAGRDDAIKIQRKDILNKRSETGLINRRSVEERRFQITVQNFRANPIRIAISDQQPVSGNAEIVVNQTSFSAQPAAVDKLTGKIVWNVDLAPKEKKVIEFGYTIEWAKGKEIEGGY
jgi:uncharacterized protein (TIGR02231 family)